MAVVRVKTKASRGRDYGLDLAALEPGDLVCTISRSIGRNFVTSYVVVRKTPTQVVAEASQHSRTWEDRWRIADGKKLGESYGPELLPPDDDEVINIRQADIVLEVKTQADKLLAGQLSTRLGYDARTSHQDKLKALAEVAELAATAAEAVNALEAQRVAA